MIAALQRVAAAAPLRDRAGAMQADVVKPAQVVAIAQDDDRIVTDLGGEEVAVFGDLLGASDQLP